MIFEVDRGVRCDEADLGDVLFWVRKEDGTQPRYQHVAMCYQRGPFALAHSAAQVRVLEFVDNAREATWPVGTYTTQLLGQKRTGGRGMSIGTRRRIAEVAYRIVVRTKWIIDVIGRADDCGWAREPYKYVDNRENPGESDRIHFTCATFVEFCYEHAGQDIVLDGARGELLPPIKRNGRTQPPRLYPGYLIKAFEDDDYPLDLNELARRGQPEERFRTYPFGREAGC